MFTSIALRISAAVLIVAGGYFCVTNLNSKIKSLQEDKINLINQNNMLQRSLENTNKEIEFKNKIIENDKESNKKLTEKITVVQRSIQNIKPILKTKEEKPSEMAVNISF
jgi:peptidoglycan hydrolase CwlO-like protein